MDEHSRDLVVQWCEGDEDAAGEICCRFTEKLISLAASRLSRKLARRVDPEDVVQSAYRSFFLGARKGQYVLERSGDLWRLLVRITLRKVYRQAARHRTGKRGLDQERAASDESGHGDAEAMASAAGPSPAEAAALADQVERIIAELEPHHRPILELRLQGYKIEEIAAERDCSERTVRRVLDAVKRQLEGSDAAS